MGVLTKRLVLIGAMLLPTALGAALGSGNGGTCQYVHVVDPCQDDLLIFNVGESYIRHNVPLDTGFAAPFDATGVDFATVPGYEGQYSFVTQGPFVRVIDHRRATVLRTIDVEFDLGLPYVELNKVASAPGVQIGSVTQHALFLVGYKWTWNVVPYFVVLDQRELLIGNSNPDQVVLAHGALCEPGVACEGTGLDISASAALSGTAIQEAYASVLANEGGGVRRQRFFRITRSLSGVWSVSLDPWNEEPVPFSGAAHRSIGLDYASDGLRSYGVFQSSAIVSDLLTGQGSCELPGNPTDVEVWGPGAGLDSSTYHFVSSVDAAGDVLIGFPDGSCPGGPDSLVLPVGAYPRALGLSSDTSNEFWAYTADKNHGITAVRLRMSHAQGSDRIEVLEQLDIGFAGCPVDLSFRDASFTMCDTFADQPDPAEPSAPEPECVDPNDPACVEPDPENCQGQTCELRAPRR